MSCSLLRAGSCVRQNRNLIEAWYCLFQKIELLTDQIGFEVADAGNVSFGPVEARDKTETDRVLATDHHDR
jgi:hypothetical protein